MLPQHVIQSRFDSPQSPAANSAESLWKPQFKEYARKKLVLVEVDFPVIRPQPARIKSQNENLAFKYDVQAYPTVVVLNPTGKKVGQLSYRGGGPEAFIAQLEQLSKS